MTQLIPTRSERIACTVLDGSAVIVDPRDSLLYWLNPVATRIWELATGTATVEAIAGKLCEEFAVDRETALRDTTRMARAFAEKQLFVLQGEDGRE